MLNKQFTISRSLYKHSFKLKKELEIPEFKLKAQLFEHKSQAQLLHFEADDNNQTFAAIFRSEPNNNQGTPHILEHLICCGSEKYPVRDPFMAMIKRSLNTYLNAWTGPDYICFPFASLNQKDFNNLQQVILDLVFKPTLTELDFRQEGARLDVVDGKLVYKGIVYNEMKGAMQNPESVFWQEMQTYLLNNSIYQYNSGGDPKDIPQLTHQGLLDYYKRTFHPSQAFFFSYGKNQPNFDLLHQYVNVDTLKIEKSKQLITPLTPPDVIPLPSQDGEKECFLAFQTMFQETDSVQLLALNIIQHVLFDNQNGLLYSIIEDGLAESFSRNVGPEAYGENVVFSISFQGVEENRKTVNVIRERIENILTKLTQEFPQDKVEAALHQIEAQFKMPTSEMGLKLLKYLLNPIINERNYFEYLLFNKNFVLLKQKINEGYLQQLIKDHFLKQFILFGQPDKTYVQNLIEQESKSLKEQQNKLSKEDIDKIIKLNQTLDNREESDFSILPTINLDDISVKVERVQFNQDTIRGVKIYETIQKMNGITYFRFKFNLGDISDGTRQYIDFFVQLFNKFGTTNFTHQQMSQMFSEFTLGLEVSYDCVDKQGTYVLFTISCLNQNITKTLELMQELFCNVNFKDRKHFTTLLRNHKVNLQNQIFDEQLQYAAQLATSQISQQYFLTDVNFNTKFQLQYAHHYLKGDNQRRSMYIDDFEFQMVDIMYTIMNKHKLEIIIHQDGDAQYIQPLEGVINSIKSKYQGFDMDPQLPLIDEFKQQFQNAATLISSQVNCSARAFQIPYFLNEETSAIQVMGDCLANNYLHREIREKGGAYGSGCSVRSVMGTLCLWSYRDPNILDTFKIFDQIKLDVDEQKLNEAKLTVFQRLDQPIEPQNKGLDYIITGLTFDQVDEMRQRVISTEIRDVKQAFDKYIKNQLYSQGTVVSEEHNDVDELKKQGWNINQLRID